MSNTLLCRRFLFIVEDAAYMCGEPVWKNVLADGYCRQCWLGGASSSTSMGRIAYISYTDAQRKGVTKIIRENIY
jgi:hypothetical protein